METVIKKITADKNENARIFSLGGEIIKRGGLVVFPTETVYGLGANALDSGAAAKIYAAKGRPSDNPLIIHLSRVEDVEKYAYTNDTFNRLAAAFMPGPLTVVLEKRSCIPDTVTGGLDTVAVRIPGDESARALIEAAGVPIAAPSANISGRPSPTCAAHVIEDMTGRADMIVDGGDCDIGVESTIVKISPDGSMILLRPGGVTLEMLTAIGDVTLDKAITGKLSGGERPEAPGMKYRHYAPNTRVVMLDGQVSEIHDYLKQNSQREKAGVLVFSDEVPLFSDLDVTVISLGEHTAEAEAHSLFAKLREVDSYGCDVFYVKVPERTGIGLAVYNRMLKAAGHEIIKL